MQILVLVLLAGISLNVANDHPRNLNDVDASLLKQIHAPATPADYSTLNK